MFSRRQSDKSVILLCVRWYLAYSLSLRDLEEMIRERGITVDHSTIHRWVIHYAPLLLEAFNCRRKPASTEGRTKEDQYALSPKMRQTEIIRDLLDSQCVPSL